MILGFKTCFIASAPRITNEEFKSCYNELGILNFNEKQFFFRNLHSKIKKNFVFLTTFSRNIKFWGKTDKIVDRNKSLQPHFHFYVRPSVFAAQSRSNMQTCVQNYDIRKVYGTLRFEPLASRTWVFCHNHWTSSNQFHETFAAVFTAVAKNEFF